MKVYFDVSCLNRPFDDLQQARIRLESEAVAIVMSWVLIGKVIHVASEMSLIEVRATAHEKRRLDVEDMLRTASVLQPLNASIFERARNLETCGIKAADAVHVAAAEAAGAQYLLTCDDRLLSACRKIATMLTVDVKNPVDWVRDIADAENTGRN